MKIEKKDIGKSKVEITVELSVAEFAPHLKKGVENISAEIKIDGFRQGKAPLEMVKQKVGEMAILEEGARVAINKTIEEALKSIDGEPIGQPMVNITKIAPENPLEYKIEISILPTVELGDYHAAKVQQKTVEVADKEIERLIEDLRESRVKETLAEREIQNNDKVIVDIKMFLDKIPVEGGQGNGVAVIIGKEYFVPGFDKHLIGAKKNDVREFILPYPADHFQKNLAGKLIEFVVTVKELYARELPEVNDEFASGFGLKKIDELKENIKKSMMDEKEHEAKHQAESEIIDKIIENSKFGDIPEALIDNESHVIMSEMEHNVASRGGKFEDYLQSLGKTKDQLILELLPNAIKRVKAALVIREIAKTEKVEASEIEIDKKIEELLKQYKGYEKVEQRVKEPSYRAHLENILINQKVVSKLLEWNLEK